MNDLTFAQLMPLLIPIVLIQLGLMIAALWDMSQRKHTRGPKVAWVFIVILVNFLGPIAYFALGREDE
jgi:hypothetical protein